MWIYSLLNDCIFMIQVALLFLHIFISGVRAAAVGDEVKTVEAAEGVNVTLRTKWTGITSGDAVVWMTGNANFVIARQSNRKISTDYYERFRDRLQFDNLTGSLSINNISLTDSGKYKVHLDNQKTVSEEHFSLTVYATLVVPEITQSSINQSQLNRSLQPVQPLQCSVECSVKNDNKVTLSWYNGSHLHSNISDPDNQTLSLTLKIQQCDGNIYSCVAANPVINQTVQLNYTHCPCSRKTDGVSIHLWLIPLLVLLVLVAPLGAYLAYRKLNTKTSTVQEN